MTHPQGRPALADVIQCDFFGSLRYLFGVSGSDYNRPTYAVCQGNLPKQRNRSPSSCLPSPLPPHEATDSTSDGHQVARHLSPPPVHVPRNGPNHFGVPNGFAQVDGASTGQPGDIQGDSKGGYSDNRLYVVQLVDHTALQTEDIGSRVGSRSSLSSEHTVAAEEKAVVSGQGDYRNSTCMAHGTDFDDWGLVQETSLNTFLAELMQGNDKLLDVVSLRDLPRDNRGPRARHGALHSGLHDPVVLAEHALRLLNLSEPPAPLPVDVSGLHSGERLQPPGMAVRQSSDHQIQQGSFAHALSGKSGLTSALPRQFCSEQEFHPGQAEMREAGGDSAVYGALPDDARGFDSREGGGASRPPLFSTQKLGELGNSPVRSAFDLGLDPDADPREWDPGPFSEPLQEAPLGLMPVLAAYVTADRQRLYIVYDYIPHDLGSLLQYSPGALGDDAAKRLLLLQMLTPLQAVHEQGWWHGALSVEDIAVSEHRWVWLRGLPGSLPPQSAEGLAEATRRWQGGSTSNLDYLLYLNQLAGRRLGDPAFHPILPWVLDMTCLPDLKDPGESWAPGWRDLSKTKWRLVKGDEQLDATYSGSETPHHISDELMSELAYTIYKARQLPRKTLTRVVRSRHVPNEYPASVLRLYEWSPDECVPEFYMDPSILVSSHPDMPDLALPDWAATPEDFIRIHRAALESPKVSRHLHHWIDVTFGYKLSGEAAVAAKNVSLPPSNPTSMRSRGRSQLFMHPHPPRSVSAVLGTISTGDTEDARLDVLQFCPSHGPSTDSGVLLETLSELAMRHQTIPVDIAEGALQQDGRPICIWELQARDIAALGRITVQLYCKERIYASPDDERFWQAQLARLPAGARAFAEACLCVEPQRRATADQLLQCDFFGSAQRRALGFLSSLEYSSTVLDAEGCSPHLAALAALCEAGDLAELGASPKALDLCLPAVESILRGAAAHPRGTGEARNSSGDPSASAPSSGPASHSRAGRHVAVIVGALTDVLCLPRLRSWLLPLVGDLLSDTSLASFEVRAGLMQPPALLQHLASRGGLPAYLSSLHTTLLTCIRQGQLASPPTSWALPRIPQAAAQVIQLVAEQMPLPVALEEVVRPLLLLLEGPPDVVPALVGVAGALGGHSAAIHLLPPLLAIITCRTPVSPALRKSEGEEGSSKSRE
eukprot:jgi/Botrbrau1/122/Bobra.0022s0108.1